MDSSVIIAIVYSYLIVFLVLGKYGFRGITSNLKHSTQLLKISDIDKKHAKKHNLSGSKSSKFAMVFTYWGFDSYGFKVTYLDMEDEESANKEMVYLTSLERRRKGGDVEGTLILNPFYGEDSPVDRDYVFVNVVHRFFIDSKGFRDEVSNAFTLKEAKRDGAVLAKRYSGDFTDTDYVAIEFRRP